MIPWDLKTTGLHYKCGLTAYGTSGKCPSRTEVDSYGNSHFDAEGYGIDTEGPFNCTPENANRVIVPALSIPALPNTFLDYLHALSASADTNTDNYGMETYVRISNEIKEVYAYV